MMLPNKIGPFVRYKKKPQAISCGFLYTLEVEVDVPYERGRMLRIYLPENYDGKKRFPVMYMCDAQNMVDFYTSAYGEWDIDDHMHELYLKGKQTFIVCGLDCPINPINRGREYVINSAHLKYGKSPIFGYGKEYANYIINIIKPLIDRTFMTKKEREFTAFGGSSMGGLCAFDIVSMYPHIFSFALAFSPAFFTLKQKEYLQEIKQRNFLINQQKIVLFSGNQDLDKKILPGTLKMYQYLKQLGYDDSHLKLFVDESLGHHEKSWSAYFVPAVEFWLK